MSDRIQHFEALVAREPGNELFRFSLAQALSSAGRPGDALPHLEVCVAKKPEWMVARILLGKALVAMNRTPEARREFEAALRLAVEQQHEDPERELRASLAELPETTP